jgi:hypothetical protein
MVEKWYKNVDKKVDNHNSNDWAFNVLAHDLEMFGVHSSVLDGL